MVGSAVARSAEGLIKPAKQLADASCAGRCRRVATEHVDDDWCRAPASPLDVLGADISVIARHELGRSRRVGRGSQDVLHLMSVGQLMQVCGSCRGHRRSRRVGSGRSVCVSGRLVRRPADIAEMLPTLATASERPCGLDSFARTRVGRVCSFEDLQDFLRAFGGISGDRAKFLLAQCDLTGLVRHSAIVPGRRNDGAKVPEELRDEGAA